MESLDLDIAHYEKPDLERLFHLPPNYSQADIKTHSESLLHQISQLPSASTPELKSKVFQFLQQAREQLITFILPGPKVMYTNPSDYYQGTMNQVEKRIVTKIVCLDSLLRPLYKTSIATDATFPFEPLKNIVSMKLSRIDIFPALPFTAAANTNTFSISINETTSTIVIPDGSYSAEEMMECLQPQLPITCTIDPVTSKCTFSHFTKFTVDWPGTTGRLFGFTDGLYSGNTSYTSEGVYDPIDKYYFVDVDDFQNNFVTNTVISNIPDGYIGKNILAKISLNTTDLDYCTRDYFGPVRIDKLKIRILNRFGNTVQLNGYDYSISFEFKVWYTN
jgi:hypothetical protein